MLGLRRFRKISLVLIFCRIDILARAPVPAFGQFAAHPAAQKKAPETAKVRGLVGALRKIFQSAVSE